MSVETPVPLGLLSIVSRWRFGADRRSRTWSPRRSHGHLGCTVGGVALLPGVAVIRRLVLDGLPLPGSSVGPPVGLVEDLRRVLYAPLPPRRVAVSPGAVQGRGVVCGDGGLPVDVAVRRLPGFEGRAGDEGVRGGLGEAALLQVAGGDGDGERAVEVGVRR